VRTNNIPFPPTSRRAAAVVLVLWMGVFVALPAAAGPGLTDAEARLGALREQIGREQEAAIAIQRDITRGAAEVALEQAAYDDIQLRLTIKREEVAAAEEAYELVSARLDDRAVEAFRTSPGSTVEVLLESGSFTDVVDRLEFLNQLQVADAALAEDAARAQAALDQRRGELEQMLHGQAGVVARLDTRQQGLLGLFAEQQEHLVALTGAREEASELVAELNERAQARAERQALGGETAPFGLWADRFLGYIQAPSCRDNLVTMVAWQVAEYTAAAWNPLATTLDMPGATVFNSHGVRNYGSLEQGLEATKLTLERGAETYGYGAIVSSLRACGSSMETAAAIRASSWCSGCAGGQYVTSLIPVVEQFFDRYSDLQA
jgi:peptidoglycan hydrolase CwlO-like protein